MNTTTLVDRPVKTRDISLDYTRIIAFVLVISCHFLLKNGMYSLPLNGKTMYAMTFLRTVSTVCVPLFILLTGYLTRNNKTEIAPKSYLLYTKKLRRILLTYILITALTSLRIRLNGNHTLIGIIKDVLNFSFYGWYIEMYIGLFLLIPILSLVSRSLDKKGHLTVVAVLLTLSALPSVFNVFCLSDPSQLLTGTETIIFPDWWTSLYPLTYWFIGAYIGNYVNTKKLNTGILAVLFILCTIIFTVFNIAKSTGKSFVSGTWNDYLGFENTIDSVLAFLIINSINLKQPSEKKARFIKLTSELTLGAYLVSYLLDYLFYSILEKTEPNLSRRLLLYPLCLLCISSLSLLLSLIFRFIVKGLELAEDKIGEAITKKRQKTAISE